MNLPYEKYQSGDYLEQNPDWDQSDSPWKAAQVTGILKDHNFQPEWVVEVGCGAGAILAELERKLPGATFTGFDIASDASRFWLRHQSPRISFVNGDFLALNQNHFDLMLLMDVIEHVPDPHAFLTSLRPHADFFVLHIPLDLCALSVPRESPLLHVRNKVGHIHYFTKGLALQLLQECGYSIIEWRYTGAAFCAPGRTWKTRLASLPRLLARLINKDFGIRLFGGETLLVLAKGSNRA